MNIILLYIKYLALIILAGWAGCEGIEIGQDSVVTRVAPTLATDDRQVLYFGVISRYNPVLMYRRYQPIMDYLSAATPYRFELKLGKTYEDAVHFLREGTVDICSLGGLTYLEAHGEFGALALVKPLNKEGQPYYHSIFIVRHDNPLKTLADLKGHSLALASTHSTSGNLIPRHELASAGVHMEDLSHFENLPHHDTIAKAVLEGRFDAGALKDIVARQFQPKGLRILHISNPIPSVPLVTRNNLSDSVKTSIAQALLKLDASLPENEPILAAWDQEFRYGFAKAKTSDYEALRELDDAPKKCAKTCHHPYEAQWTLDDAPKKCAKTCHRPDDF